MLFRHKYPTGFICNLNEVDFMGEGPAQNVGVGNGDHRFPMDFDVEEVALSYGKAMLIVRTEEQGGPIRIKAGGTGLRSAQITVQSEPFRRVLPENLNVFSDVDRRSRFDIQWGCSCWNSPDSRLYIIAGPGKLCGHDDGHVLELVCDADWADDLLLAFFDCLVSRRAQKLNFRKGLTPRLMSALPPDGAG